ncbi:MAG: aromatic-ring-hydroxylating dioxygenase subunit beta [Sphingomonas bacterium]
MTFDLRAVETLLYDEARYLDEGRWDEWLDLYVEDAVFWIPAWKSETEVTNDPSRELSLVYYQGRKNLEDRVWRARSGMSVASAPLPRVVHQITNISLCVEHADGAQVASNFSVHLYDKRSSRTHMFFGRYSHSLLRQAGSIKIAQKKIILLNDTIPTALDFYCI